MPNWDAILTVGLSGVDSLFSRPLFFSSQNWEVDEEAMEARLAECQANANAAVAKWKYECQRANR